MSQSKKEGSTCLRLIPCPTYDPEGMEDWLSALAEEGLFLEKSGILGGVATFERGEPRAAKYRLEAVQRNPSLWDNDAPDPEEQELGQRYSWEYVARRQDFYIYRTFDPEARELHTDPAVQALALNAVKKRRRSSMLWALFGLIFYPILLTRGCFLLAAVSMGSLWISLALLLGVLIAVGEIRAFVHLKAVQESLLNGEEAPPESDGQKSNRKRETFRYFARRFGILALTLFLLGSVFRSWGLNVTGENRKPLDEYGDSFPFATIRDFARDYAGEGEYAETSLGMRLNLNTVVEKSDWIAPRCLAYNEYAEVQKPDGTRFDGGLYVDYCEMRTPALANRLARELCRQDRLKNSLKPLDFVEPNGREEPFEVDFLAVYRDRTHFPTAVIQKGRTVVRASLIQFGTDFSLTTEEWIKILCGSLKP